MKHNTDELATDSLTTASTRLFHYGGAGVCFFLNADLADQADSSGSEISMTLFVCFV